MYRKRRSLWLYPLFQIPLMALIACLLATLLFGLLGLGRPNVAVAIALDLSGSTYGNQAQGFNRPGTLMAQEVAAVQAYVHKNAETLARNQIQIFGFGREVVPLTPGFETDPEKLETQLLQALNQPGLAQQIGPEPTNLSRAIERTSQTLSQAQDYCRELLLVTDGEAAVLPTAIATALAQKVKINAIVVGAEAPLLRGASAVTGGIYLASASENLAALFTDQFFLSFNSNNQWIRFWLGAAWIALMWVLVLPLDRWVFQGLIGWPMNLAGQMALANALFWTVATPGILWRLGGLPFLAPCP